MIKKITGTITSVKTRNYKGGKYYRVTLNKDDGGEISFDASVESVRQYAAQHGKDSISDLVGTRIFLQEKK